MKKTQFILPAALAVMAVSCGTSETDKVEASTADTVVQTEVITVNDPIDSAAVAAHYDAAHKVSQGTHQVKHKTHKTKTDKKVRADSHTPVEHHDVLTTTPAPASTNTEAAPATGNATEVIVIHDVDKVYFRPDEKASFPGGEKAFDEFLHQNLEYPEEAVDRFVEGTVHAVVTLDEQGNVTKVEFPSNRLGYGIEEEARRILMMSPRWNPAKHAGVGVKSKFGVPITFDIE